MQVRPVSEASIVGRVIDGRYRVIRHLADGGMGSVFVAIDERLDREVALKVMRAELARDDAFVARFRREARSAARLAHPNVVAVTDQGSDDHYAFLAMELVNGSTLRQLIRTRGALPTPEALALIDPILDGLAAAHRAGLVHRDVKPENVLISESGQVKVTDFGLARAVTTSTLTGDSDILLGTASYLGPEQVEHGTADARTDVYAAGLLLFEMLTGEKAFPGDSPIHVAYQHVHGSVPRASDAVPSVPPAVDRLIGDATAKNPDERPANAAEFLMAVRSLRRELGDSSNTAVLPSGRSTAPGIEPAAVLPVAESPADESKESDTTGSHTRQIGHTTNPLHTKDHQPDASRSPRRSKRVIAAILIPLLLVAAIAGWVFTVGPLGPTKVPTLNGLAQGVAVTKLRDADLNVRVEQAFSETVPSGQVVVSEPKQGSQTRKNSTVLLRVSKGPERFSVPAVANTPEADARSAISKASLTVGTVTQAYDDTVPSGRVVSSTPASGEPPHRHLRRTAVLRHRPQWQRDQQQSGGGNHAVQG